MAFLISWPFSGFCHGVSGSISSGGVAITAEYDDGSPMSYAETEIKAPDSDLLFSSGWTDRNGRFCFFPDVKGIYQVVIQDGMGHRLQVDVPVDANMKPEPIDRNNSKINRIFIRYEKIMMGLTVLFFLSGCVLWYKGNQNKNKGPSNGSA